MKRHPDAPAPNRALRKSERTRQAIFDAAIEFLRTHPFRDMTVNRLMAATTLSRPTFYQYFKDLHELMEALLADLETDVLRAAALWQVTGGDRITALRAALKEVVDVSYRSGPLMRAVSDAAPQDHRLEIAWKNFLGHLDSLVADQIEREQAMGLIAPFDAMPVAVSLNRMDVLTFITRFGQRPRAEPGPVLDAITRIWTSTLYAGAGTAAQAAAETRHHRHGEKDTDNPQHSGETEQ